MCRNDSRDNWQYYKKYTICGRRCPNVTIKNMKCTKKKLGDFLFRKKSNHEKKLMRTRRWRKAMRKKRSCPAEIYELQLQPVCVLCCLMAAAVSDWQCANATHSVQTCQSGEQGEKKIIKKIQNAKWKCTLRPAEEGSRFLSLLARTPKNKMLRASTQDGDYNDESAAQSPLSVLRQRQQGILVSSRVHVQLCAYSLPIIKI